MVFHIDWNEARNVETWGDLGGSRLHGLSPFIVMAQCSWGQTLLLKSLRPHPYSIDIIVFQYEYYCFSINLESSDAGHQIPRRAVRLGGAGVAAVPSGELSPPPE